MSEIDTEEFWRIDGVPANRLIGPEPTPALGETATYEFEFSPMYDEGPEEYQKLYYELVDKYSGHAGNFAPQDGQRTDINGVPWYREQHQKCSLVVPIRPPKSSALDRGMWGIIENIDGGIENKDRGRNLRIDLRYLADLDEYSSKEDVSEALEADGI
jgi:hypothetical protein